MSKMLSDGKKKFTACTTEPANPAQPTAAELAAGIQGEASIFADDFTWGAADSDTNAERALADKNNVNAYGASNYQAGITVFRFFDGATGAADATEDVLFAAAKAKGTELWCYVRETGKDATEAWAASDEIILGAKVITDESQPIQGGYIKRRIPMQVQEAYPNIAVAAPAV